MMRDAESEVCPETVEGVMPLMWRCELRIRLREAVRAPCMEYTASSLNRGLRGIMAFTERDAFRTGFQGGRRSPCMWNAMERRRTVFLDGLPDWRTGRRERPAAVLLRGPAIGVRPYAE